MTFDKERAKAFTGRVINDAAGAVTIHLCSIGDRLGLFKDLKDTGPTDAVTFASRTDINISTTLFTVPIFTLRG